MLVPPSDVEACAARTTSDFRMHALPGDHEFLVERRAEIMQIVGTHLERLLGGPRLDEPRDRTAAIAP